MKITSLFLTLSLISTLSYSQIKKSDLRGIWFTENKGELYSTADTIKFYQRIESCNQKMWIFEKRKFRILDFNNCSAETKVDSVVQNEKIKLRKADFGQIIEYYQNNELKDRFRIVSLKKKTPSELTLMRFDELQDELLYKYVDSLTVKVLKYNPIAVGYKDSIAKLLRRGFPHVNIRSRSENDFNRPPVLIINGHLVEKRELLKKLLLVETYYIRYLTAADALQLYGAQARNGVIILQTSNTRFKAVLKNCDK